MAIKQYALTEDAVFSLFTHSIIDAAEIGDPVATVTLKTPDGEYALQDWEVDYCDQTIVNVDVDADIYALTLHADDITSIVLGDHYLLVDNDGFAQVVEFVAKRLDVGEPTPDSGTLTLLQPLARAIDVTYADVSLHAMFIEATLGADTYSSVKRGCLLTWKWTSSGKAASHQESIDFVHLPFAVDIFESDIEEIDNSFGEQAGKGRWHQLKSGAVEDVYHEIRAKGFEPDRFFDRVLIKRCCILALLVRFYRLNPVTQARWMVELENAIKQLVNNKNLYDADDDGIIASSEQNFKGQRWLIVG